MNQSVPQRILLVEDDSTGRNATAMLLESQGYTVVKAGDGREALALLGEGFSLVLTDLVMPQVDGMELLRLVREEAPHTPVIMFTGHGSEEAAVQALKSGAFHYLAKPVNPEELLSLVRQAVAQHRMATEIAALHAHLSDRYGFGNIIGKSSSLLHLFEQVKMVADTRSTVLIEGESGTGKELFARAIHLNSSRSRRPFVAINCASIPESLINSELFGHQRGAFTGAVAARSGKFQAASGGTLLIDEIGEMPLELQSKLLRVIETRRVDPLGADKEIPVDVRILAATHRDLERLVAEDKFRQDLYYRLNVVRMTLPPLRERREDIPLLVRAFIDEIAGENQRPVREISPEALAYLQGYDWPGNVRQLKNTIESIVVMSTRSTIDVADLPPEIRGGTPVPSASTIARPGMTMAEIEKEAIRQALLAVQNSRTEASRMLGISVRTLQRKIKSYGLVE